MGNPARANRGYSLIELIVVLAIVGILVMVAVASIGNRQAASVRSLMDELEGALTNARQAAAATGRDVAIDNWGNWTSGTPLVLAYGDATLADADLQTTANKLLASQPVDSTLAYSNTVAVPFHFMSGDPNQARARIVITGSGDWPRAMLATPSGAKNQEITGLDPFLATDANGSFNALATTVKDASDENAYFSGALQRLGVVNGSSQRFNTSFIIEIVGTNSGVGPLPGSAMGLIVVLANGTSIYKFYNPGCREGNGQWRKI